LTPRLAGCFSLLFGGGSQQASIYELQPFNGSCLCTIVTRTNSFPSPLGRLLFTYNIERLFDIFTRPVATAKSTVTASRSGLGPDATNGVSTHKQPSRYYSYEQAKMAIWSFISTLSFFLLASRALALQVTPNSPCAAICLDDASQDVSDPKTSNTFADDIVCLDSGYAGTAAGKKYKACVSCLQASSASGSGENDQGWFLCKDTHSTEKYEANINLLKDNLRYTLSSCLFDLTNVTDAVNTPCSTQTSCGPLQQALEHGILDPENESTYAYCSADSNAFLGSYLDRCIGCLQGDGNEKYLANCE
jgi:hypothetical protein